MPNSGATDTDQKPVYVISVAAELSGMHAQTLRAYDRLGLVSPGRTSGGGRRYSERDVEQLREVARLSQEEGVSRNAIKRILDLQDQVTALRARVTEMQNELARAAVAADTRVAEAHAAHRRDLVPINKAVVVWRPVRK